MSGIWPGDTQCVAMLTFDVDGVSSWLRRDAKYGSLPSLMSMAEYGPSVAAPRILDLLDKHAIKASFYVPGYVAESHQDLVREIAARGHELGHHQHRHTLRGIGRGLLISLVFNYIFGSTGGDVVSGAVKLAEMGHSRHDERQADDFGFRLAYASFGNADGYLDFFQKLRDEYESHDTHWLKFLNSHPPTGERLDDLKKLRDQLGER